MIFIQAFFSLKTTDASEEYKGGEKKLFWWLGLRELRANFWVGSLGPCAQNRASLNAWVDYISHKTISLMLSIRFVFSSLIKKGHMLSVRTVTARNQVLGLGRSYQLWQRTTLKLQVLFSNPAQITSISSQPQQGEGQTGDRVPFVVEWQHHIA